MLRAPSLGSCLVLVLWAVPTAHGQTITTTGLSAASIPVNHPGALLLLALAIGVSTAWLLHRGGLSSTPLRAWALGGSVLVLSAALSWGEAARAQLQELQGLFNQPGGQTLPISVQATGTATDGSPQGFLPVVYTNQTAVNLRISGLTAAAWSTCFPLGVPAVLPTTAPRPATQCGIGTVVPASGSCWVDVAQLCADAAAAVRGSQPSTLQADTVSVIAGTQATGNVLTNDSDPDGPLQVTRFTLQGTTYAAGAAAGAFSLQGNGAFTFLTANPYVGANPLLVTYTTQTGTSSTLSITVNAAPPANHAPVANADAAVTTGDAALTIAVRANDTDADGDALTVTVVTQGAHGSVIIDAVTGNPIYTPNTGFTGPDSFTYTVSDGNGGTSTATVGITVNAAPPVNHAPVANADAVATGMNSQVTVALSTLLANDTDADGDTPTVQSVQAAVNGTVSLSAGNAVFTPANGFEGAASFTYTISDGQATSTATVTVAVGSATAPSVVVLKSLLAVAHGTAGTSLRVPITTALVDMDGSETLSIKISGVPTGLTFNAGTNLGGGVWQFAHADLTNLMLNLPGSYTTLATHMTVMVTATEASGGFTATTSAIVTLKAAYTTVDITTTESGNYTGSSANEYIEGGSGNNIINAGSGNNIVLGGNGVDTLSAGTGNDVLEGGAGNDDLQSGSGTDVLIGGPGNDTLKGGDPGENFVDVFVWRLGDQGSAGTPAVDTIHNFATAAAGFNTNGGDVLDLGDLLQGEAVGPANDAGNLANYLHFEITGGDTIIHISHTGGFAADSHSIGGSYTSAAETQQIILSAVNLQSLYSGATTDRQIISQLLNNNKLIVD